MSRLEQEVSDLQTSSQELMERLDVGEQEKFKTEQDLEDMLRMLEGQVKVLMATIISSILQLEQG